MKPLVLALSLLLLGLTIGTANNAQADGPPEWARGSVIGLVNQSWLHSFDFEAYEMGASGYGKGYIIHKRLLNDGVTIKRAEFCPVVYTVVDGKEAWFSGPVVYDSTNPGPTHWMVFYAHDGGWPGPVKDLLLWDRVGDENAAFNLLGEVDPGYYKDFTLVDGNVWIRPRPRLGHRPRR